MSPVPLEPECSKTGADTDTIEWTCTNKPKREPKENVSKPIEKHRKWQKLEPTKTSLADTQTLRSWLR